MRILHVTKKFPYAIGGDAVVVANLKKHQEIGGHEVSILTSNCPEIRIGHGIYKFGLADSSESLDNITLRRIVSLLMLALSAFYILYRERPDVVHAHSIDMAFAVSLAARMFNIPLVHTFHIVTFYDKNQSHLRRSSELLLARLAGLAFVTAPNLHDVNALKSHGLEAKLLTNGVDTDFWQSRHKKRNKTFEFVSVGRLETQKGFEYLLRAVALLTKNCSKPFTLTIIGEGSQRGHLEDLASELNITDQVVFLGQKNLEETREALDSADAAVCASLFETTPLTILEAWAMCLPVVSTPVGILKGKRTSKAAYIAKQTADPDALFAAMQTCLEDKSSRKQKAEAGNKEAKRYTWETISQSAENMYGSII